MKFDSHQKQVLRQFFGSDAHKLLTMFEHSRRSDLKDQQEDVNLSEAEMRVLQGRILENKRWDKLQENILGSNEPAEKETPNISFDPYAKQPERVSE